MLVSELAARNRSKRFVHDLSAVMNDVTRLIERIESGDGQASEELLPLVYSELRSLAVVKLASEKPGQTLQATALVHEAYLRLVDQDQPQNWENTRHFFSAAAEAMRRILIERARQNRAAKRGGDLQRVEFRSDILSGPESDSKLIALDEALEKLSQTDSQKAELVKLRFFGGLTIQQTGRLAEKVPIVREVERLVPRRIL